MSNPTTFAFLVHPRTDIRTDLRGVWRPLGSVPNGVYSQALRLPLPARSVSSITVRGAGSATPLGHVILVPRTPAQMLATGGRSAAATRSRLTSALDVAGALGANLVGLGALTAPAAGGGRLLSGLREVGITNGNAFTAHATVEGVRRLLPRAPTARPGAGPLIALVGATGSVGSAVARELVRRGLVDRLLLVARNRERLDALAAELRKHVEVTTSTDMADVRRAGLVVLLTSSPDAVLHAEHLGPRTVVLDDTQPRNTSPDLLVARPDVRIVDGGIVEAPGLQLHGASIGLGRGLLYACLAETALLALSGHRGDFAVGHPTPEQVAHVVDLAQQHQKLGFHLAAPQSFGRRVDLSDETIEVAA